MKNEIAQAFLFRVMEDSFGISDARKYFQTMAKFKYDDYQQYSPGLRFFESLSLWLKQFNEDDKPIALNFIRERLVFVSQAEMNLLITSVFPDLLRNFLVNDISKEINLPEYMVGSIISSSDYKKLLRQSLFCGMSDGAKIEIFRRANTGIISHEQIYQTYELSNVRASKMQDELVKDLCKISGSEVGAKDNKFKRLFLLDDFSASGTSYLKLNKEEGLLKGKIPALYKSIFENEHFKDIFDLQSLKVYIVLYLCTNQAKEQIEGNFKHLHEKYGNTPQLLCMHIIPDSESLNRHTDKEIIELCEKDEYYDSDEIEDEHTRQGGNNVKLGFGKCALPLVLNHNTPNNSVPLLWSYDTSKKFVGLFPRIPRHKEI